MQYYNVIDKTVQQLKERFDQPGVSACMALEQILLNGTITDSSETAILSRYDEISVDRLTIELAMFKTQYKYLTVEDAAKVLATLSPECRSLFSHIEKLIRNILVLPCSSTEPERSFSTLRRVKTWLRSTMTQARLNHMCILTVHDDVADSIELNKIAGDFISKSSNRQQLFGNCV